MPITSRQTGSLAAENWTKVYQTFKDADFTSYDFESLRKTMIDYIRLNYPEEYNDYIESSEFIALIDLIAFLGQSLAFRADLNARENFIDTAERRDSILKLARLISYNPKRTTSAHGYLKIDSITTTETIYDSDGNDLSNRLVLWNDNSNPNWQEQFIAVINASLLKHQNFGRPSNSQNINNIRTEEYGVNLINNILPVFKFETAVNGISTVFEAISATSQGKTFVYESDPDINRPFNILYRNDGYGNGSNNTGFFFYFKQGELSNLDISVDTMIPNRQIDVDVNDINNTDVWLYKLDSKGFTDELWTQVPTTAGINVIYNTQSQKNLYQVNSRANDQISLIFGDGSFANIPQGTYKLYYRTSNGLSYKITPDEMRSVQISLDYVSRSNRVETITFAASLRYTVANASARETAEEIKLRAPQQYYTQNRMVTGEDYNIFPYSTFSDIRKVKALNRISSGLSRYLDILDTTGKYSSTNIFGEDGVIYSERLVQTQNFNFQNDIEVRKFIRNEFIPNIIDTDTLKHSYYESVSPVFPEITDISEAAMIDDEFYQIASVGTTNFIQYGASSNTVGEVFKSSGAGNKTVTYIVGNIAAQSYMFNSNIQAPNRDIRLKVGDTLELDLRVPGHPFHIKTSRTTGLLSNVTVGTLTNNGAEVATLTWDTTGVPPGTYYYTCRNHAAMGGNIIIESFGTGVVRASVKWNQASIGNGVSTGHFTYNGKPIKIGLTVQGNNRYLATGAMVKFVPDLGYKFNSNFNQIPGAIVNAGDSLEKWVAIKQIYGDGTNNDNGNFVNGTGPVVINLPIPTGAVVEAAVPTYKTALREFIVDEMIRLMTNNEIFGLVYSSTQQNWIIVDSISVTNGIWDIKFDWNSSFKYYVISYKTLRYVFHSPRETNFFFDRSLQVYDPTLNRIIRDNIKVLKSNGAPNQSDDNLNTDIEWYISSEIRRADGYVENKSVYLTYADSNQDGVPDAPNLFDNVVLGGPYRTTVSGLPAQKYAVVINYEFKKYVGRYPSLTELNYYVNSIVNGTIAFAQIPNALASLPESTLFLSGRITAHELVFFELVKTDYGNEYKIINNATVITLYNRKIDIANEIKNYNFGQLFYAREDNQFYRCEPDKFGEKSVSLGLNLQSDTAVPNYVVRQGRQNLYYQYRHNSPNSNRIDPNISNIIDLYVLTIDYDTQYRLWLSDSTSTLNEPEPPTNLELYSRYSDLENYKSISDTIVIQSAQYKPLFGSKAQNEFRATFKVVKNPLVNTSDADIKSSVIAAINEYFAVDNWDFGETFYFSELAAFLHKRLSPNIASIVIVSKNTSRSFGSLYQVNSEPYELIVSAATVDDVEIVSAISAIELQPSLN